MNKVPDNDLYRYRAEVLRVVDGDTFEALIDVGFAIKIAASVRILGIDAPELKGDTKAAGEVAKAALTRLLAGPIRLRTEKPDSFGRALAEVWFLNGPGKWESVAEVMIRSGYAVPKAKKGGAK
jgi:micrococcal nuclease